MSKHHSNYYVDPQGPRHFQRYDEFVTKSSSKQNEGNVGDVTSNSSKNSHSSYDCELHVSIVNEPATFEEATSCNEWKDTLQKEYDALIKNGTWRLVDPPIGIKPIRCKWVYKIKYR